MKGEQIASCRSSKTLEHGKQNWQWLCVSVKVTSPLLGCDTDLARPAADIKVRQAGSGAVVLEEEVSPIQSADAFHRRGSDLWISMHTFPGLSANDVLRATEIFSFIIYILYLILYISFRDKHPCIVEK